MNDDLLTVYLMGVQDGKNQKKKELDEITQYACDLENQTCRWNELLNKIKEILKDPDRDGFDEDGYDDSYYDMVYVDRIKEIIKEFEENK